MSALSPSPSPLASNNNSEGENIKTVVEERVDEQDRKVRITRKIRMFKVTIGTCSRSRTSQLEKIRRIIQR